MLNILVVDDEPLIRRGIVNKIERLADDCLVVGEAQNGEEAITLVEQTHPDIVITDIKMPKVDGLLFIEKAIAISPSTKFIIVSGYDDFEYAQKAVRLGVFDYLLKPISNSELQSSLNSLRSRIEVEKQQIEAIHAMQNRMDSNRYEQMNRIISKMGDCTLLRQSELLTQLEQMGLYFKKPFFYVCVLWAQESSAYGVFDDSDNLWRYAIANISEESFAEFGVCAAFYNEHAQKDNQKVCLLINCDENNAAVREHAERAVSRIQKHLRIAVCAGISKAHSSTDTCKQIFQEAETVLAQKIVLDLSVIMYEDYLRIKNNDYRLSNDQRRLLTHYLNIEGTTLTEAKKMLSAILFEMKEKQVSYNNIKLFYMDILLLLRAEVKGKNSSMYPHVLDRNFEDYFYNVANMTQLKKQMFGLLDGINVYMCEENLVGGKRIVNEIEKRLSDEYFKELKLSQLAMEYYINPSYLSTLFQRETGKNFSKYLSDLRIEKSIELLKTTQFSTARIAEFVGYNDRSYFASVFQKTSGMSPSAYRRQYWESIGLEASADEV